MTHQESALKLRSAIREIMLVSCNYEDDIHEIDWDQIVKDLSYAHHRIEIYDHAESGTWPEDSKPRKHLKKVANRDCDYGIDDDHQFGF